jgi:hypothetical protein
MLDQPRRAAIAEFRRVAGPLPVDAFAAAIAFVAAAVRQAEFSPGATLELGCFSLLVPPRELSRTSRLPIKS